LLGPQSLLILFVLVAGFAGLVFVQMRQGALALRLGAAVGAFLLAAVFGIACVNKFYDYYQTWGDLANDLTGHQPATVLLPPGSDKPPPQLATSVDKIKKGQLIDTVLAGRKSGISRHGLIYLPPQYFQQPTARFPVMELLHGSPGRPADWETALHLTTTYLKLLNDHKAKPAVIVMPDSNGGETSPGQQCLNLNGGLQVDTYLSSDVPEDLRTSLRVEPTGAHWGIGGFSEGGFCAANLTLRHRTIFHLAASMSGYYQPLPEHGIDPFHGNAQERLANDPTWLAGQLRPGDILPLFWLMAGSSDRGDLQQAQTFRSLLVRHEPVPLVIIPRTRHTFAAWNPALPKLLVWATNRL
jgi:enterochelin esterase-like enzyme